MAVKYLNHHYGENTSKGFKINEYYIDKRKQFLEFLAQMNEEYRLNLINSDIIKLTEELKSIAPDIFETYQNGDLFSSNMYFGMKKENEIALASYIEFLKILKNRYEEIEQFKLKFGEIKWIGGYSKFIEFHQILNKYEFVNCDLLRFRQFFSFRSSLNFNLNLFNTSILFYKLNEKRFITEQTLNKLIENVQIFGINGRYKKIIQSPIDMKIFNDNKSKYIGGKFIAIKDKRGKVKKRILLESEYIGSKPYNRINSKLREAMSIFGFEFD